MVGLHSLVALAWEAAEFTADQVLGAQAQKGNTDTMTDLIVGTLGALLVALALYAHRTRGWFPWLSRFAGARTDLACGGPAQTPPPPRQPFPRNASTRRTAPGWPLASAIAAASRSRCSAYPSTIGPRSRALVGS